MSQTAIFVRRRRPGAEPPVELRFVDMLLIIIATLMFVTILFSVVSAFNGSGRPDVAPEVLTRTVPEAVADEPYQLTLAATGGDGAYVWSVVGGELPAGLALSGDGIIEGRPEQQQTTGVSVQVRDGSGRASEARALSISVRPAGEALAEPAPPRIADTTALLPDATAGRPYEFQLTVEGGGGYSWQLAEGAIPRGLELAADGALAGRPDEPGTYTFTVAMTGTGDTANRQVVRLAVTERPESLLWRILGWVRTIITWIAYLLLALVVGVTSWEYLFGRPDTFRPGKVGRLKRNAT
jgi:hypothetical protein